MEAGGSCALGRGPVALWTTSALLVSASIGLWLAVQPAVPDARWTAVPAFLLLAAAFALSEVFVAHVQFRRDTYTFSLVEVPFVVGLVFAPPLVTVLALVAGGGFVLAVYRRQAPIKLAFNTSVYAFTSTVAVVAYHHLPTASSVVERSVLFSSAVAAMLEAGLAIALVSLAVGLSGRVREPDKMLRSALFGTVTSTVSIGLGVIAVVLLSVRPELVWLTLVPAAGIHLASGAYLSERRRHEDLEFLHRSTALLHRSEAFEAAVNDLLAQARDAFRCEVAEILLRASPGHAVERILVGPDGADHGFGSLPSALVSTSWVDHLHSIGSPLVVSTDTTSLAVGDYLAERGVRQAIAAPLTRDGRTVGTLTLADPFSDVTGFSTSDLRLIETLANQVSVALDHGRLEQSLDQLRMVERALHHEATHDGLTGLANRSAFHSLVQAELDSGITGPAAVLFIDLDDFKSVNDTFGHAAGDELLVVAARRIQACLRTQDLAARLGGDEFTVFLTGGDERVEVTAIADRILHELGAPFTLGTSEVAVRASIGVAIRTDSEDVSELLRDADTAMYTAKAKGKHRVEVFDRHQGTTTSSQFSTASEISRAIEQRELAVHFQPVVSLDSGSLVGAESLVRWEHTTRGLLAADKFIDVARTSDAIVAIDRLVLDEACAWLARFDALGSADPFVVSVNLGARELLDPSLADLVATRLALHGIEPNRLVVEFSEGLAMQTTASVMSTLKELRACGVSLALVDYGAGLTSIRQLRDLPVQMVKVAKSVVDAIDREPENIAFARAIIEVAHVFGATVVAQGVERPDQVDALASVGCDHGQGYFFARPMERAAFEAWYSTRGSTVPA